MLRLKPNFKNYNPKTNEDKKFSAIVIVCFSELKKGKKLNSKNALKGIKKILNIKDFDKYMEKHKGKIKIKG